MTPWWITCGALDVPVERELEPEPEPEPREPPELLAALPPLAEEELFCAIGLALDEAAEPDVGPPEA
jgi:hypothetical protein